MRRNVGVKALDRVVFKVWTQVSGRVVQRGIAGEATLGRLLLLLLVLCTGLGGEAQAQYQYVNRNNTEYYLPYIVGDHLSFWNPAESRYWEDEYTRRYLAATFGEARINRKFFLDAQAEGIFPYGMPGYAYSDPNSGRVQEIENLDSSDLSTVDARDVAIRMELYGFGHPAKLWDLGVQVGTRAHFIQDFISSSVYSRLVAVNHKFVGTNPFDVGFYVGPEVKPLALPVGGLTVAGFGFLTYGRATATRGVVRMSWWGEADPFQNQLELRLGQVGTLASRRLQLQGTVIADVRQVRTETYELNFGMEPLQGRYIDLAVEGSALLQLPERFKLSFSGRVVPYHTPDANIVRLYRPVWPEASVLLNRKLAVFELSAGYTYSLVPPKPVFEEDYADTGSGIIPGSAPGHLFTFSLGLKI